MAKQQSFTPAFKGQNNPANFGHDHRLINIRLDNKTIISMSFCQSACLFPHLSFGRLIFPLDIQHLMPQIQLL